MTWNDPVNDKKWTDSEANVIKVNLDRVNYSISTAEDMIKRILNKDTLTFMEPMHKIELLTDLRDTLDKLDNAKTTMEVWLRSPDIYKA